MQEHSWQGITAVAVALETLPPLCCKLWPSKLCVHSSVPFHVRPCQLREFTRFKEVGCVNPSDLPQRESSHSYHTAQRAAEAVRGQWSRLAGTAKDWECTCHFRVWENHLERIMFCPPSCIQMGTVQFPAFLQKATVPQH